jgi:hypothetical protein
MLDCSNISSISSEGLTGESVNSVVGEMKDSLVYANHILTFTTLQHRMQFKATAAVGK